MRALQLFRCLVGKHHRDRRRVAEGAGLARSVCQGCGKPMVREFGEWRLALPQDAGSAP